MKKAAERLALFFLVTQVDRVATFIHLFQPADTSLYLYMSYGVAIGLAYGVYVSFFYVRQPKVRTAAIFGIVLFGGFDLLFNELALIKTASAASLVSATSSFLWIPADYLRSAMQGAALAYGILPTLASAALGWIQGGANKVTEAEMGTLTFWGRIGKATSKLFDSVAVRLAVGFEAVATKSAGNAPSPSQKSPVVDGVVTPENGKKRWRDLTADDVAFISANGRPQIMARYGISDGAAGNWKADIAKGKRPWVTAKLPENV